MTSTNLAMIIAKARARKEKEKMIPISINKFADLTVKNNSGTKKAEMIASLKDALARKNAGAVCMCSGNTI